MWNLAEVGHPAGLPDATVVRKPVGAPKRLAVTLAGLAAGQAVRERYVDQSRGSPVPAWAAMGKPRLGPQAGRRCSICHPKAWR